MHPAHNGKQRCVLSPLEQTIGSMYQTILLGRILLRRTGETLDWSSIVFLSFHMLFLLSGSLSNEFHLKGCIQLAGR